MYLVFEPRISLFCCQEEYILLLFRVYQRLPLYLHSLYGENITLVCSCRWVKAEECATYMVTRKLYTTLQKLHKLYMLGLHIFYVGETSDQQSDSLYGCIGLYEVSNFNQACLLSCMPHCVESESYLTTLNTIWHFWTLFFLYYGLDLVQGSLEAVETDAFFFFFLCSRWHLIVEMIACMYGCTCTLEFWLQLWKLSCCRL